MLFSSKTAIQSDSPSNFNIEALEDRQLLSWGPIPQLIDQDLAVSKYPAITGKGVVIADLDSGINFRHPALAGRIWRNPGEIAGNGRDDDGDGLIDDINGWNYLANNNNVNDDQGHGTMTAGFMVANHFINTGNTRGYSGDRLEYQGVAAGAQVLPFKVSDAANRLSVTAVEKALQWIVRNHTRYNIQAINLSADLGSYGYSICKDELATLWNSGVYIAASSGNGYSTNDTYSSPASSPYAASVGAALVNGTAAPITSRGPSLDILTPGSNIPELSRDVTYWLSGTATSYAAPWAAAAGALVKQINPKFSAAQVNAIIHDSGQSVWDAGSRAYLKRLDLDSMIALAFSRSGQAITPNTPVISPTPTPAPAPAPVPTTGTRRATDVIQAESFSAQQGIVKGSTNLGYLDRGDYVAYKGIDFGTTGVTKFTANLAVTAQYAGKQIQIHLDSASGPVVGALTTRSTGSFGYYTQQAASLTQRITGVHTVYLTFSGDATANLDWFRFA